jgi:hypothetical protein
MGRFKLFLFYQLMALMSLYKPEKGLELIEIAEYGQLLKSKQKIIDRFNK